VTPQTILCENFRGQTDTATCFNFSPVILFSLVTTILPVPHARLHLETNFIRRTNTGSLLTFKKSVTFQILKGVDRYMEYLTLPLVPKLTGATWKPSEQISSSSPRNQYSATPRLLLLLPLLILPSRPLWSVFFLGWQRWQVYLISLQITDMEPNNSMSATGRIIHWYSLLGAKRPLQHQ
jgi:hypothetical protein